MRRRSLFLLSLTAFCIFPSAWAVKCLDCVGEDCLGNTCEGDYCVLSKFAPRWGSVEWGEPQVVKGCMKGSLLRKDVRDHCEVADDDGEEVFTCFCKSRDNCNGPRSSRLPKERVELLTCQCSGAHCKGKKTCLGELCTYVENHRTHEVEKGCLNASVPLVERRSMGSCMIPPITGAMHHSVAKDAADLLKTESCVCGNDDYCNSEKPEITVKENEKCHTFVKAKVMGTPMVSKNISCTGEFCFKASIKSKIGMMSEYTTMGCASFTGEDMLAEELNPAGCAKFLSENLEVEACFQTKDRDAIGRARAKTQVPEPRGKSRGKQSKKPPPKIEVEYEEEEEEGEGEEAEPEPPKEEEKPRKQQKQKQEKVKEEKEKEEEVKEEEKEEKEEEEAEEEAVETTERLIYQKPTEPPIPDESNTTMITVFILIMLCIVVSGAVWKLELHKKLFRSSYDTVAGG